MTKETCSLCQKRFSSGKSLQTHVRNIHDGGSRNSTLVCQIDECSEEFNHRPTFEKHVASHSEQSKDSFTCQTCGEKESSLEKHVSHLDEHLVVSVPEEVIKAKEDDNIRLSIRRECIKSQVAEEVANFLQTILVPHICIHANGQRSTVFALPESATTLLDNPIDEIRPLQPKDQRNQETLQDLESALDGCHFRALVDVNNYKPMDQSMFLANYGSKKYELAKAFAGALIQTPLTVVMILKAEVYGRQPGEDTHGFDLVAPDWELYKVAILVHDNSRKLIVGTSTFSILITSSIELTVGTVSVGPSNSVCVSARAKIWTRKDQELNVLVKRQLRSKFDHAETFDTSAAVYYRFAGWKCQPVTIFSLFSHYQTKRNSGIRSIAELFYDIERTQTIKKGLVQHLLQQVGPEAVRASKALQEILSKFQQDEEERPLGNDRAMSQLLQIMADEICDPIRRTNESIVRLVIAAKAEDLIASAPHMS
ncbi:hypothetical protein BGW38_002282 [Lunasporangiospora selenospora]|uniref:C2H2-type domain-containing protein n=1 Tax=Lunasporangiospora selenospora TaxID=979761 RepID=A0A9P6KDN3_9FUNG|nr:hypothetical protein BGW38_002282 [Lunasporangiospora selenospora]